MEAVVSTQSTGGRRKKKKMRRWQRFTVAFALFFFSWFLILQETFFVLPKNVLDIVELLPLWILVTFGSYSLFVISWRLIFFPECPEAAKKLQQEMAQAREDLKKKGYVSPDKKNE
eukprot:TRINITY_DN1438_c0_g2_i10.p1 TRINITY_DN1438_c0_g2~~TRINITY_DN1438_c0_g2_i10.p1  ORF type:complete len:116 (-),score=33.23 TRINITY_DN1438_c0_g2_i10:185-532(-)